MPTLRFRNQRYSSIRSRLSRRREKFVDQEFAPPAVAAAGVEWQRPTDLVRRPRLITDGVSGDDAIGGGWFGTACSVLTVRTELIALVVPDYPGQDYGGNFHPGVFRFEFGRRGRVYRVVVDDRLPTRAGRPAGCHSADGKEFWSSLLEKAYAKLHGGYQALANGRVCDAIASFGRGVPDNWDLRRLRAQLDLSSPPVQERLAKLMKLFCDRGDLLLFSLRPEGKGVRMGGRTAENLVYGRGYLLMDVQPVRLTNGDGVWLLKLQTARFADRREWLGPWRDGGFEWTQLDAESAERVNHWFKADCIFWISLPEAVSRFTDLDMCLDRHQPGNPLASVTLEGRWFEPGVAAQFLLRVPGDGRQTVTLCLEQGTPEAACRPELLPEVGLQVRRADENSEAADLAKQEPGSTALVAASGSRRLPSATVGASLAPGVYLVLATRWRPQEFGDNGGLCGDDFTLRAFSRLGFELRPLSDLSSGSCSNYRRSRAADAAVCRLTVTGVAGRFLRPSAEPLSPMPGKVQLRVSCRRSDLLDWRTGYYETESPEFVPISLSLLIHGGRISDQEPVEIEVLHSRLGSHAKTLIGRARVDGYCGPTESALIGQDGQPISARLLYSLTRLDN